MSTVICPSSPWSLLTPLMYADASKKKLEVANKRTFIRKPRPLDWDETLLTTREPGRITSLESIILFDYSKLHVHRNLPILPMVPPDSGTGRYADASKKKLEVANKRTFIRKPRPLDWDETLLT
jgi:hypothetical protein